MRVGGAINCGDVDNGGANVMTGAIDFGGSTVYLGKDFTVRRPSQWVMNNWSPGTATVICTGNGTAYHYTQTLRTYGDCGIALNNLRANNPGGVVQLYNGVGGGLILTGNLLVDNGTFLCNGRNITFTGKGKGLAVNAGATLDASVAGSTLVFQGGGNDCTTADFLSTANPASSMGLLQIRTGSPTFLQLLSDVKVGGLTIDNGCGLVLNDHTLTIGTTPISLSSGSLTYGLGTIYAHWSDAAPIPEPATCLLIGTGVLGLLGCVRRRRVK